MTRIWFDVLTPKQALFCLKIAERLGTSDFDIRYTTRRYAEVTEKLSLLGIPADVVGRHGGAGVYEKLLASADRVVALAKYVHDLAPDIAFAFASPESARVAFGLGIPYFTANDSPHSRFVAQLTIPLALKLFTPWFMKNTWKAQGVPSQKIISYHGLDPVAWLEKFTPNIQVFNDLGLDPDSEYVVIRPEEAQASYLHGIANEISPLINPVITTITEEFSHIAVVVLCRYAAQREVMRQKFGNRIILPDGVIDAPSLLASAILLVGAGGTMNQEASLLGVPVISCYPGAELETERYLIKNHLLYRIPDPVKAAKKTTEILTNRDQFLKVHKERAQKLMKQMENPVDVITTHLLAYTEKD
ncbi:MAG: DUF354 domain-containing protein [Candidatus Hodarchaeota archaeon]